MQAKHISRAQKIFTADTSITTALWLNWRLPARRYPMIPRLFELKGYIQRRQGKQEEGLQNLERAVELDPRNLSTLQQIAISYERSAALCRSRIGVWIARWRSSPTMSRRKQSARALNLIGKRIHNQLHRLIDSIRLQRSCRSCRASPTVWFTCALAERDAAAAKDALVALGETPFNDDVVQLNRLFVEGVIARMTTMTQGTDRFHCGTRASRRKSLQAQPDYGPALCVLGLIDAALGRKEEALRRRPARGRASPGGKGRNQRAGT